ncbi:MAG: MFS transporter [Patescibacteria group bacterium]
MKLDYRKTFVLGLGFFAISISWSVYNSYVPVFLKQFTNSAALIGFIMTLDNIAAILVQPYFGSLSDRTWNRFGRRMPFLLIGVPLSAVLFAVIPLHTSLAALVLIVFFFNAAMTIYRAPTVALMPDLTPSPLRSKANGIINFMGGIGTLLAFFVASILYDRGRAVPFVFTSMLMLAAAGVLFLGIKERRGESGEAAGERTGILRAVLDLVRSEDKSALAMLGAIFFWFLGYAAIEAFFTLYGKLFLGIKESAAAFSLGFLSVAFLLMALPSGFLATRWGRRRTIVLGIICMLIALAALHFSHGLALRVPALSELWLVRGILIVAGLAWALININSYPMVVDMTVEARIGTYTGLYYLFSSLAAVGGPLLLGGLIDLVNWLAGSRTAGYGGIFAFGFIAFALALLCMTAVRRGEAQGG